VAVALRVGLAYEGIGAGALQTLPAILFNWSSLPRMGNKGELSEFVSVSQSIDTIFG